MATLSMFVFALCSFLLLNRVQSITEEELFTFGTSVGDSTLFANDDEATNQQCLSVDFPFFGASHDCLFVHNNGIITLSKRYIVPFIANPFPIILTEEQEEQEDEDVEYDQAQIIAPFWADVDTTRGGSVRYRETEDSTLLTKARDLVHSGFVNHRNFDPTVLFVATWEDVGYFREHNDKTNTFQCVLATDSTDLYAIFLYANIEWTTGDGMVSGGTNGLGGTPAKVGFNAGDQRTSFSVPGSQLDEVINITETSNIGQPGVWVFRVGGARVESGGCGVGYEVPDSSQPINIFPNFGTILGGDTVFVQGCFTPGEVSDVKCQFDTIKVPALSVSSIEVVCVTPAFTRTGRVPFRVVVNGEERGAASEFTVLSIEQGHEVDLIKPSSTDITLSNDDTITLQWDPDTLLPPLNPDQYRVDISLFELNLETETWQERKQFKTDIQNDGSEEIVLRALQTVLDQDIAPLAIQVATSLNTGGSDDNGILDNLRSLQQRAAKWTSIFYFVKDDRTSRLACDSWYREQSNNDENLLALKTLSVPCPPRLEQARAPNSGLRESLFESVLGNVVYHEQKLKYFHPGAGSCFSEMVLNRSRSDDSEQQCCYDNSGNLLIGAPGGGSIDKVSPKLDHVEHIRQDVIPYIQCCKGDTPSCWKYYERRPSDNGRNYDPPLPAWTYGDPHITTLDGFQYTFNGHGEFVFIATNDNSFTLQGRMEPVSDIAMATVLTAIVAKETDSDTVMFVRNRQSIVTYVNGREINMDVIREQDFRNVTLKQNSSTSVSAIFSSGIFIQVRVENGFISTLVVHLPRSYYGNTRGLMGVYNGDPMDDLMPNDGGSALLLSSMQTQQIHSQFGITWIINEPSDSLFTYLPYESFTTIHNPTFTPQFGVDITSLDPNIVNICNVRYQCLYDVARTGDTAIGVATNAANIEMEQLVELSLPIICNPPCQNGVCTANDTCVCAAGYSGSTCSTPVVESCDVNPCGSGERCGIQAGSYVCVNDCTENDTRPFCTATQGPCSNNQCLNNGVCTPIITSSTSDFTCECLPEYNGERCNSEVDTCRSDPCLNGGTCQVNSEDPNGYICICPPENPGVNCNETITVSAETNLVLIVSAAAGGTVAILIFLVVLLVCCMCCRSGRRDKDSRPPSMMQNGSMRESTLVVSEHNPHNPVYDKLHRNSSQLSQYNSNPSYNHYHQNSSHLSVNGNPLSRNSSTLPSSMPSSETLPAYSELDIRSTRSTLVPPEEFRHSMPSGLHDNKSPTPSDLTPHNIINTNANNQDYSVIHDSSSGNSRGGNYNNNGNNTPTPSTNSNNSIDKRQLTPLYQRSHEGLDRRGSGPLPINQRQCLSPTNSLVVPGAKGPGLRRHSYQCITYVHRDERGAVSQTTAV